MDGELVKLLVDVGSNGFLIYLVLRLLSRIDAITDRLLANQEIAAAERAVIAKQQGLTTQDLSTQAAQVLAKRQNQKPF